MSLLFPRAPAHLTSRKDVASTPYTSLTLVWAAVPSLRCFFTTESHKISHEVIRSVQNHLIQVHGHHKYEIPQNKVRECRRVYELLRPHKIKAAEGGLLNPPHVDWSTEIINIQGKSRENIWQGFDFGWNTDNVRRRSAVARITGHTLCTLEVNIKEGVGPQHPLPVSNLADHHLNYHRPAE
jgi:hypothetical protein